MEKQSFLPRQTIDLPSSNFEAHSDKFKEHQINQELAASQLRAQLGEQGSGVDFQPLRDIRCANNLKCMNVAPLNCSSCYLVAYCSKNCQKDHWKTHKSVCQSAYSKPYWKPDPTLTMKSAYQDKMSETDMYMKIINAFLWGNVPAFDHIYFTNNEGLNSTFKQKSYNVLFAASGDLRHLFQTFDSTKALLENVDVVHFYLNDMNQMVSIRNLFILYLLSTKYEEAIDMAINIWYSSSLTSQQSFYIRSLFMQKVLGLSEKKDKTELYLAFKGIFEQNKNITVDFSEDDWKFLISMIFGGGEQDENALYMMIDDRNTKFNRDMGLIQRNYSVQEPNHREAFDYFRQFGLLMPMSSMNAQLNAPNLLILHPEHGWVLDHGSNPLYGWPMKKVLASNNYDVPVNDLYGRLFFYIVDKMTNFVSIIKSKRIFFHFSCKNAIDLLEEFKHNNVTFDRIDVSNISDENYIGIRKCLELSRPLLNQKNKNSKLITTLMNWVGGTEFGCMNSQNMQLVKSAYKKQDQDQKQILEKVVKKLITVADKDQFKNPQELMLQMTNGQYFINLMIKYLRLHTYVFDEFLQPFEKFAEQIGLKRSINTIREVMVNFETEVIDNLNDVSYERFVEWSLDQQNPGLSQISIPEEDKQEYELERAQIDKARLNIERIKEMMNTSPAESQTEEQKIIGNAAKKIQASPQSYGLFKWSQTNSDIIMTVVIPHGTKAKELNIQIKQKALSVGLKGKIPIVEGQLPEKIEVEDSYWEIEGSNTVSITLQKSVQILWNCALIEYEGMKSSSNDFDENYN